jgi:L-arabinose transport system ATP-binding protein
VRVSGIEGHGLRAPVSLDAAKGEILGFFGRVGAGRTELFRLLFGATSATAGTVAVNGQVIDRGPRAAISAGLGLAPEDRKDQGIVPLASVRENIALAWRNRGGETPLLRQRQEAAHATDEITRLRIKTPGPEAAISTLSGGNQQKAIIARWLLADASILLLDEPTRGIDVGARSEIYGHIYDFAERGGTVLLASSDLPEVLGVADRIVVMRDGAVSGIVPRADATAERLLRLALPDAGAAPLLPIVKDAPSA